MSDRKVVVFADADDAYYKIGYQGRDANARWRSSINVSSQSDDDASSATTEPSTEDFSYSFEGSNDSTIIYDKISFLQGTAKKRRPSLIPMNTALDVDPADDDPAGDDVGTDSAAGRGENEANRLVGVAGDLLARGKNSEALEAYGKAMHVARGVFKQVQKKKRLSKEKKHLRRKGRLPREGQKKCDEVAVRQLNLQLLAAASTIGDVLNNMGVVQEMEKEYDDALRLYRDALDMYQNTCRRHENTGDAVVDQTVKNIARIELVRSTQDKRKSLYKCLDKLIHRVPRVDNDIARQSLRKEAVNTFDKALQLERETFGPNHPVVANTLIRLGKFHYEAKNLDAAAHEIECAVDVLRKSLGKMHPNVGRAQVVLGLVLDRKGDRGAMVTYLDALDALKYGLGDLNPEVGSVFCKIGAIYQKKGDLDNSLRAFQASLNAYGVDHKDKEGTDVHPDAVSVLKSIGEVHAQKKDCNDALRAYNHALRAARQMDSCCDICVEVLQDIGQIRTEMRQYQKATTAYKEALLVHRKSASSQQNLRIARLSGLSLEGGGDDVSIRTGVILKKIGDSLVLEGNGSEAMNNFLQCLNLFRSGMSEDSDFYIAGVLGSIGWLHLKRCQYDDAVVYLEKCLHLHLKHGTPESDPSVRDARFRLAKASGRGTPEPELIPQPQNAAECRPHIDDDDGKNASKRNSLPRRLSSQMNRCKVNSSYEQAKCVSKTHPEVESKDCKSTKNGVTECTRSAGAKICSAQGGGKAAKRATSEEQPPSVVIAVTSQGTESVEQSASSHANSAHAPSVNQPRRNDEVESGMRSTLSPSKTPPVDVSNASSSTVNICLSSETGKSNQNDKFELDNASSLKGKNVSQGSNAPSRTVDKSSNSEHERVSCSESSGSNDHPMPCNRKSTAYIDKSPEQNGIVRPTVGGSKGKPGRKQGASEQALHLPKNPDKRTQRQNEMKKRSRSKTAQSNKLVSKVASSTDDVTLRHKASRKKEAGSSLDNAPSVVTGNTMLVEGEHGKAKVPRGSENAGVFVELKQGRSCATSEPAILMAYTGGDGMCENHEFDQCKNDDDTKNKDQVGSTLCDWEVARERNNAECKTKTHGSIDRKGSNMQRQGAEPLSLDDSSHPVVITSRNGAGLMPLGNLSLNNASRSPKGDISLTLQRKEQFGIKEDGKKWEAETMSRRKNKEGLRNLIRLVQPSNSSTSIEAYQRDSAPLEPQSLDESPYTKQVINEQNVTPNDVIDTRRLEFSQPLTPPDYENPPCQVAASDSTSSSPSSNAKLGSAKESGRMTQPWTCDVPLKASDQAEGYNHHGHGVDSVWQSALMPDSELNARETRTIVQGDQVTLHGPMNLVKSCVVAETTTQIQPKSFENSNRVRGQGMAKYEQPESLGLHETSDFTRGSTADLACEDVVERRDSLRDTHAASSVQDEAAQLETLMAACPTSHHEQLRNIYESTKKVQLCTSLVATWIHLNRDDDELASLIAICPAANHDELRRVYSKSRDVELCRKMITGWKHLEMLSGTVVTKRTYSSR